ncbi:hypothetical protein I4674_10510 [Proteus mirabilis]|nr:hypothetical protein [Proteus mirabilis]
MKKNNVSNYGSKVLIDDGLVVAGYIKERLGELIGLLDSNSNNYESLVREINVLLKEYEQMIECADNYNPLSTRHDNW